MKDIIDEVGIAFFSQEEVNTLGEQAVKFVEESLERIVDSKKTQKEAEEDEDNDDFDQDDIAVYKQEIKTEYECQINAAEVIGILLKTHKEFIAPLVSQLRAKTLPEAF